MVRTNTKRKANHMIKKQLKFLILLSLISFQGVSSSENNIYNKIDLFGEVLEKINKEYVDEINQSESMDSAINGLPNLLILTRLICHLKYLTKCKLKQVVSLVDLVSK